MRTQHSQPAPISFRSRSSSWASSPFLFLGVLCGLCGYLSVFLPVAQAEDRHPVDWNQTAAETIKHFDALLRINTSNPPGNETDAAEYLKAVLEAEGIDAKLLALEPRRANLVARIRGNGSKRPLLVMGHTDVVGVERDKWTVESFAAEHKDGFIYGRGAVDDKDNLVPA